MSGKNSSGQYRCEHNNKKITTAYAYACVHTHVHCEQNKNVAMANLAQENRNSIST